MRGFSTTAVYLRLSADKRGDELGVTRQREDCLALIKQRGWTPGREYVDNDTSASGKVPRPQFEALLADLRAGTVRCVVAWNLDRLVRTTRDRLELVEACQRHGAVIALVRGSDLDASNPAGRLYIGLIQEVAQHELDVRHDRQTRAMRQIAESGRPWIGNRPFGYERDGMRIVEAEAKLLRAAYKAVAAGDSLYGIAKAWNTAGVVTTFGNQWSAASVRQVLANPRYAGLRAHNGEIVGKGQWAGVVTEGLWRATERVLTTPGRRRHHPVVGRRWLLSGIALCGRCGETLTSAKNYHGTRIYRCRTLHLSRMGEPLDLMVTELVIGRLSAPDARSLLVPRRRKGRDLSGEATALRARLESFAEHFGNDPTISPAEYRAMRQPVTDRLAQVEQRMADAAREPALAELAGAVDVRGRWGRLPLDRQRVVVAALMTVTVRPAVRGTRGFDPGLIDVVWRT